MTFRLPDYILTWIFTPRRLFRLVDLSYVFGMIHSPVHVFFLSQRDGHCGCLTLVTPCVETGSQKTNLMLLCITLWNSSCFDALPVSTGNLLYSAFRSHRKGQANPLDFRIPIALDAPENDMRSFLPSLLIHDDPHNPYLLTHLTKVFSAYFAVLLFDLIPFKCDYLSVPNNFKPGFFRKVVRNQTPSAVYSCDFLSSNSLYTTASLVLGSRLSILPFLP